MVSIFEAIEKIIELRESLLEVPLIIPDFELDVKEHSSLLTLVLRERGDRYLDSRG
jgi:hypothetical protein